MLLLFGGPDGELAASMRYLSQRYTMPYKEVTATLTDIGTEELAHMEMICAIVHQLTKNLSPEEIEKRDIPIQFFGISLDYYFNVIVAPPSKKKPAPASVLNTS